MMMMFIGTETLVTQLVHEKPRGVLPAISARHWLTASVRDRLLKFEPVTVKNERDVSTRFPLVSFFKFIPL
jgi:hypothetical protein